MYSERILSQLLHGKLGRCIMVLLRLVLSLKLHPLPRSLSVARIQVSSSRTFSRCFPSSASLRPPLHVYPTENLADLKSNILEKLVFAAEIIMKVLWRRGQHWLQPWKTFGSKEGRVEIFAKKYSVNKELSPEDIRLELSTIYKCEDKGELSNSKALCLTKFFQSVRTSGWSRFQREVSEVLVRQSLIHGQQWGDWSHHFKGFLVDVSPPPLHWDFRCTFISPRTWPTWKVTFWRSLHLLQKTFWRCCGGEDNLGFNPERLLDRKKAD